MTDSDFFQTTWRKSSRSDPEGANCVEIARLADDIGIRDSKHPTSDHLAVTTRAFSRFVSTIKAR